MITTLLKNHFETDTDLSFDIKNMVKERGKTCITIIVPTHQVGQDRQGDRLEVERAVFSARQMIQNEPTLLNEIDQLVQKIDYDHNKEGLGLFISRNVKKLVQFPFSVTTKVVVDKMFHLQDLLYLDNYNVDYYILDLSKKEIRFFRGKMDQLEEIKDHDLPMNITDDHIYTKPSQSSSDSGYAHVKQFEKDKSLMEQLRLKNIFYQLDRSLAKYVSGTNKPIILCGSAKTVELYKAATNYSDNIITTISDNFHDESLHKLGSFAKLQIQAYVDRKKLVVIDELKEKLGERTAVAGIEDSLRDAKLGKGLKLVVERNYSNRIAAKDELSSPVKNPMKLADVVTETINTVLEKKGHVIIMEKDALKDFGHIAMINRY